MRVETWVEEFEEISELKLIYGRKALRGMARTFISGKRGLNSWAKLKKALIEKFKMETYSTDIHKELRRRKIKETEDAMEYFMNLRKIAGWGEWRMMH